MSTHIEVFKRNYDATKIKEVERYSSYYGNTALSGRSLHQSEAKYRSIFDNLTVGIFQATIDGKYVIVNPMLTRIYGYKYSEELINKLTNIKDQLYVDNSRYIDLITLLQKQVTVAQFESQVYRQDGTKIWISENVRGIYNSNHQLIAYEGTVEDITQRKQAEIERQVALTAAIEVQEIKSHFVSMVSHEFRAALSVILASSDLLKLHSLRLPDEQKVKYFNKISSTVKNMTEMLDEVLTIGKAEARERNFKLQPVEVPAFCQEMLHDIHAITQETHKLIFNSSSNDLILFADKTILRQMFMNLLLNAVKYSPQGSRVFFNIVSQDEEIIFIIKDEGIGILQSDQENLFEEFHRGENAGKFFGTGLGLAIVKRAVELHQGKIFVESEVGVGTTFTVSLPLTGRG